MGNQPNTKSQWSIRLIANSLAQSYTIQYPSLKCGGRWTQTSLTLTSASFNEQITYGADKCVNGGSVTLRKLSPTQLQFDYAGGDATAASYVELDVNGKRFWGVGIDPDISTASLKAVVSAVNRGIRAETGDRQLAAV